MTKPAHLLILLPLLGGCFLFESKATRAMRASPDYRAGYGDGCNSATAARSRDDQAYKDNPAYRRGWNEGNGACRSMPQTMPDLRR
jgi:hypothetical protein